MTYRVLIDDNFHYMDPEYRSSGLDFETLNDAVKHCQRIVDGFLADNYRNGMSAEELLKHYKLFGEDPFITGDEGNTTFSAWDYARRRASEITQKKEEDR